MSLLDEYNRVTKRNPCPICGREKYCLVAKDGGDAICTKISSSRPVGEAGWKHTLDDHLVDLRRGAQPVATMVRPKPTIDAASLWERLVSVSWAVDPAAAAMGIPATALERIGIACIPEGDAFPMRDASGGVIGIRIRARTGEKTSIPGSRNGLFFDPLYLWDDWVYVVEGPTDTASMLSIGCPTVGRAACSVGDTLIAEFVRRHHLSVCIVADADAKVDCPHCTTGWCRSCRPGQFGAMKLAEAIHRIAPVVKIVEPPHGKDVRDWIRSGATAKSLTQLRKHAEPWSPS